MPKPESILQSAKGGPYEKYAVVYTYNKIQINIAEILERWDKDHNIPEKLPRQEIREDGTIRNYRVDNPDAMVNKLLANSEIITRHQPEDYEYDENRKKIYGRKYDQGASPAGEEVPIDPEGADRELSEALKPIREAVDSYINSDDDDTKQFKEIIEINMVPMQYERGDFTRAMMDNLYLADLYSQTGGCPKIKNYTFKELREHLDGPIDPVTGKQTKPLKLISRYYKGINELFDMEYAKQKLMDKGYTPEDEKQYLEELKATQQQMIDAFDELKEFESEHKGEFDTTYLSNELYHLVDYERAPIAAIGQLKGQIQAINNGWSMDDLTVLGLLGAMNEQAAFNIRTNKKKLEDERKALERDQKALNEKETELAELRKTKDEEKIKKAENEVKKIQSTVESKKRSIDNYERAIKSDTLLRKEIRENERLGWNKKIEKPGDKVEILNELQLLGMRPEFADSAAARMLPAVKEEILHLDNIIHDEYIKGDASFEWAQKGMPAEMRPSSYILSRVIDIYGPNPKYHTDWAIHSVAKRDEFEEALKPYDSSEYPFSDMELAFIGMGATMLYSDKKKEILDEMKPETLGFDQKMIDINNTTWSTDLFSKSWGPRASLLQQGAIIQEGRQEAQEIAKDYVNGNKKKLAEVIHNAFRQSLAEERTGSSLTIERTLQTYYMNKTFLNMLSDPELQNEFNAVNNEALPKDKVDLDVMNEKVQLYKHRLDGLDAKSEIKNSEIPDRETEKRLVHDYFLGKIINEVYQNDRNLETGSPAIIDKRAEFEKQNNKLLKSKDPKAPHQYTRNNAEFNYDNYGKPEIFNHLSTETGMAKLEEFTNTLISKYALDAKEVKEFEKTKGQATSTEDLVEKEILKFTYETAAEKSYAELESGKELSEKEMRDLTKEIIRNKIYADRVNDYIAGSELDPLVSVVDTTMKSVKGRREVFNKMVDNFVNNINLKDISSKELAEVLKAQEKEGGAIREITNKFAAISEFASEKKNPTTPNLGKTVDKLREANLGFFGNGDYKAVIKDLTKLNKDVKTFTEQLFKKRSDKGFDELKVKYNNLLKKMETYQKENEQYEDYEERCELMGEAIKDMKQTMGYLNKHRDNLEAVNEYIEYSRAAKEMAQTSSEKQIEPFDYLNKRIHEEEVHRQNYADKVLGDNNKIKKEAGRDLAKSCFNALYMQVVKDEYAPKPGETPEQKAQRDDTLLKAIDRGEKGTVADMKKIVESEFGKKYIANCKKMMIAGKQFSQEKLMECRDMAITQCYDEYIEKFRSAKNRKDIKAGKENCDELINLSRMSKALGSKALEGKKLPALRNDSKVQEFNLKIDNKPKANKIL